MLIGQKIADICSSRNYSAACPCYAKKECVKILVDQFFCRTQETHVEIRNHLNLLQQSIHATTNQLYAFRILRSKSFYEIYQAVEYSMNEWLNDFLNDNMGNLINELN
jgi:hypothetical protein